MTLYIQTYPYRHRGRLAAWNREVACEHSLRVNVHDEEDALVLKALLPGLKTEDVTIQVLDDVVHIEGTFPSESHEYLLNELPSGSFRRTLRMPAPIQADKVEASMADGVLTLRLPKAESARPKKIKVSAK